MLTHLCSNKLGALIFLQFTKLHVCYWLVWHGF